MAQEVFGGSRFGRADRAERPANGGIASGTLPSQVGEPSLWQSVHTTLLVPILQCQAPHRASHNCLGRVILAGQLGSVLLLAGAGSCNPWKVVLGFGATDLGAHGGGTTD